MSNSPIDKTLIQELNAQEASDRLNALAEIAKLWRSGAAVRPDASSIDVNNHIHTTYSFSPYSPTMAVFRAIESGLSTCGIVDHDSISGANEFIDAGKIAGIATTSGLEVRVSLKNSPFSDRYINNTDQRGIAYVTAHGIPHNQFSKLALALRNINAARNERNKKMVDNINKIVEPLEMNISYEGDVVPISMSAQGGAITERHILFALSKEFIRQYGKGDQLLFILKNSLKLNIPAKTEALLIDVDSEFYAYDLLGLLKSQFSERFYVDAGIEEAIDITDFVAFVKSAGAIPCAAYLGDVADSVTGDKKSQKFEDEVIDELFDYYASVGIMGVTYMPSRNSDTQIARIRKLCDKLSLIQISGEDVNQPRQSFICEKAHSPEFANLIESTWALIGNEIAAEADMEGSIISPRTIKLFSDLDERISHFAEIGRNAYNK